MSASRQRAIAPASDHVAARSLHCERAWCWPGARLRQPAYYAEIVRGLGACAREHDYELLLCDTGSSEARERAVAQMLTHHLYDGVVCMDPFTTQQMVSEEVRTLPWVPARSSCPTSRSRPSASTTGWRPRMRCCTCWPRGTAASR